MPMTELDRLAWLCGQAAGADRALDIRIGIAVGQFRQVTLPHLPGLMHLQAGQRPPFPSHASWQWSDRGAPDGAVPPYTGLIEAAQMILPPKVSWSAGQVAGRGEALVADTYVCTASTPALALCTAALLAVAAIRRLQGAEDPERPATETEDLARLRRRSDPTAALHRG